MWATMKLRDIWRFVGVMSMRGERVKFKFVWAGVVVEEDDEEDFNYNCCC